MILALLTTMNSKVKVHVIDGSKCVLDRSHDKEEPGPSRPSNCRSAEVLSGPLSKTTQGLGLGQEDEEQEGMPRNCEASVQSRLVVDNGVKSLVPFPEAAPCHTRQASLPVAHGGAACLRADVMTGLQNELDLESRHDEAWQEVAEGEERGPGVSRGVSRPVLSPPAAAPAPPSGPRVSSSSGWTSSRS